MAISRKNLTKLKPENWDEAWKFFPIRDFPLYAKAEKPEYWDGYDARWPDLEEAVRRGCRPALLTERSGLVVLDCDVRGEFVPVDGRSNSVRLSHRYGTDDLARLCREREKEIPATFTVSTPSGGTHLYFRQNPACPVASRGQRNNWLIDVKASRNTYVVSPPSDGYAVTQDHPAAVLPYWLARHTRRMRSEAPYRPSGVIALADGSRDGILRFVAEANSRGGWVNGKWKGDWNPSIYWAAHRLIEAGEALEDITAALIEAAQPWDEREAEKACRTIASAWRKAREK